jgi:ABC-2 type transport system permease protein
VSRRRVTAIVRRLLQQFRRDKRTLALIFVAPVVILTLFDFLLRGGGANPAVVVVNEDRGPLGGAVTAQLQQSSLISVTITDRNSADAQVARGDAAGEIVFGSGFSENALSNHLVVPEIRLEGSEPGQAQTVLGAVPPAITAALSAVPQAAATPRLQPHVSYVYGGPDLDTLDYFGAAFIGLVVFFLVYIITSVSFLRERSQGTLERLMASPLRRGEIVVGYMAGFCAVALVQAVIVLLFSLDVVHVHNQGSPLLVFLMEALMVLVAVNLGIFLSAFARTEFQAVQFIPLVILPQVLLSGILVPVTSEPGWLQVLSRALPLTYAVDGLRSVMLKGADLGSSALQLDLGVVAGYAVLLIGLATLTLRRRIA